MPDAVPQSPLLHRMWFTPVSDALRGRLTGRLDVEGRMERAGLPAPARELIRRVVRRTSLWRVERANVADELIAHFADGLEGGQAVDELIASFGDERRAAKLIRRAKRRNRPLPWHAMVFLRRLVGALVVFYLLLTAWFYSGRPSPAVDRLAELNARVAQVPEDQRAWPLYRDAIIAAGLQPSAGAARADGAMLTARPGDARWDQMAGWLGRNSAGLEPARRAHEKPVLGLPVARQGQDTDPALRPPWPQSVRADRRAVDPSEAHVVALWRLADALAADAHAAADRGDVDLALRDVIAILGIARHMRDGSQAVGWHNDNVALGRRDTALEVAEYLFTRAMDRMTPADLRRLAHALAEPDAARDLVSVDRVAARDGLRLG